MLGVFGPLVVSPLGENDLTSAYMWLKGFWIMKTGRAISEIHPGHNDFSCLFGPLEPLVVFQVYNDRISAHLWLYDFSYIFWMVKTGQVLSEMRPGQDLTLIIDRG